MNAAEKRMHLESAPRSFQRRNGRETAAMSATTMIDMLESAEYLTKADAIRVAQTLLVHVYSDGIGYEDVQSAQAVTKYVGRAISALRGLGLS